MKNIITFIIYCLSVTALLSQADTQSRIVVRDSDPASVIIDVYTEGYTSSAVDLGAEIIQKHPKWADKQAVSIHIDGGSSLLEKGKPDVPKLASTIQIAPQGQMAFEVLEADYDEVTDLFIAPSKGNLSRKVNPSEVPFTLGESYAKDQFFPGQLVTLQDPFILRESRGQHVWFHPVQYNPAKRIMRIYHHLRIRVYKTDQSGTNELPESRIHAESKTFSDIYRRLYINTDQSSANQNKGNGGNTPEKMLVLCPDTFVAELEPFVRWKRQMGIHTTVVTSSQLGSTDTSTVAQYVKQSFLNQGITYLLIAGDETHFPPLMRQDGSMYSCDNCFGYLEGNDYAPEVMVGRLHASTPEQLRLMVARNLEYEKHPLVDSTANWMAIGLAAASDEGAGIGDDGQADWEHANEWKTKHLADGYETYYEFYDGSHGSISPTLGHVSADAPGNPSADQILSLLNGKGASLYNYTGHGWEAGLVSGNFSTTAVQQLTNANRYPILIGVACCAGHFTSPGDDCLGEALQRAGNSTTNTPYGAIASFLSSDFQSWTPPMEGQDAMNQYLVDADGIDLAPSIGGMAVFGNMKMIEKYAAGGELMAGFWNPFHEPSFVQRTRMPEQITAMAPAELLIGQSEIVVQCSVEGALVGIFFKDQTIGAARVQGGIASVPMETLQDVGDLIITVSQFNHLPWQQTVKVKPQLGPFVVQKSFTLDDSAGNQNQLADYGEIIKVNVQLSNVGLAISGPVTTTLSCQDPFITITDNTENWGEIADSTDMTRADVFRFRVADSIPDGQIAIFQVRIDYGGTQAYMSSISVTLQAPKLTVMNMEIDDTFGGNGNRRLESNETATIRIKNRNNGRSASPFSLGSLTCNSTYLTVSPLSNVGVIAPNSQEKSAQFNVTVAPNAPDALSVNFEYHLDAGPYSVGKTYAGVLVNAIIADFEAGAFTTYPWTMADDKPWTISTVQPYSGAKSSRSGVIGHNKKSSMVLTLDVLQDAELAFAYRTSSEDGYDFLRFQIDSLELNKWSGTKPWTEVSFPITKGPHQLKWTYQKDEIISEGSDAVWVDEVILPPFAVLTATQTGEELPWKLTLSPNPATAFTRIDYTLEHEEQLSIGIFDASGKFIRSILAPSHVAEGTWSTQIATDQLAPGVYFVKVQNAKGYALYRLIKM